MSFPRTTLNRRILPRYPLSTEGGSRIVLTDSLKDDRDIKNEFLKEGWLQIRDKYSKV
jgi:hypothetical protein